jgi:hypothetical protein
MAQPVVPRRWAKNALDGTGRAVPGILWGLNLNADGKAMGGGRRRGTMSRFPCGQKVAPRANEVSETGSRLSRDNL